MWFMTAAISGAHTIGSAKPENSGYDGTWSDKANQGVFNNDYYHALVLHGWGPEKSVGGNPDKNQWKIIDDTPTAQAKGQMMLNTDLCMYYWNNPLHRECMKEENRKIKKCSRVKNPKKGKKHLNAKTDKCCAWQQFDFAGRRFNSELKLDYCGRSWREVEKVKNAS